MDDVHCVNNIYKWSTAFGIVKPVGPLFTDFLANLNRADGESVSGVASGRKHYGDWRIPSINELRGIVDCSHADCLDPVFGLIQAGRYWSSTTNALGLNVAWAANFGGGLIGVVSGNGKSGSLSARAVRGGR